MVELEMRRMVSHICCLEVRSACLLQGKLWGVKEISLPHATNEALPQSAEAGA